jgi:hypothetical protein
VSRMDLTNESFGRSGHGAWLAPSLDRAVVVIPAPGEGPGHWAGAPSAVFWDGAFYLAYRLRRPVGQGRGYAMVVARSEDGVDFQPLAVFRREEFGSSSLERPALVRAESGRWRLYVSCATPGTLHWRVEVLEAESPDTFRAETHRVVLPGDEHTAVKDPVVLFSANRWQLWASCHDLSDPAQADRMVTGYAESADGEHWTWGPTALAGRPGHWDERGVRVASVLRDGNRLAAYYDGRGSAAENGEERTGLAIGNGDGKLRAISDEPFAVSPYATGSLRYLTVVALDDGTRRLFYEATGPDGAHSLYTEQVGATG